MHRTSAPEVHELVAYANACPIPVQCRASACGIIEPDIALAIDSNECTSTTMYFQIATSEPRDVNTRYALAIVPTLLQFLFEIIIILLPPCWFMMQHQISMSECI